MFKFETASLFINRDKASRAYRRNWHERSFFSFHGFRQKLKLESICLYCATKDEKEHESTCLSKSAQPYSSGLVLRNSILWTDDVEIFVLHHVLQVECQICFELTLSQQMWLFSSCGHMLCISCLVSLCEKSFDICPFCNQMIFCIGPVTFIPESFLSTLTVYAEDQFAEDCFLTADTSTGFLELSYESAGPAIYPLFASIKSVQWMKNI